LQYRRVPRMIKQTAQIIGIDLDIDRFGITMNGKHLAGVDAAIGDKYGRCFGLSRACFWEDMLKLKKYDPAGGMFPGPLND